MPLDPRYVLMQDLEQLFVDQQTGLALANGQIYTWVDDDRNVAKPLYELTGAPPNYTYTALPNPLNLSAIGTPDDQNGNTNVALYYYPYDQFGNPQLYYVSVYAQGDYPNGAPQFTREAWPNQPIGGAAPPGQNVGGNPVNMLSNPEFVVTNWNATQPLVIPINGNVNVQIAPGWNLVGTSVGATQITVTRNPVAGTQQLSTNPAYTLTIDPGAAVCQLVQVLNNISNVWAQLINAGAGVSGYVATSMSFSGNDVNPTIYYTPNNGTATLLFNQTNNTGTFATFNQTIQLPVPDNASTSDTASVSIIINLPQGRPITLSSVQCIAFNTFEQNVPYDQAPVERQLDHLAHYYDPLLAYKNIPSWLVGWDFPLNPAQILTSTVGTQALGANTSYYAWDQTIIFQSVTSSANVARGTNGGFQITAAAAGQIAIVQYLGAAEAQKIINDRVSCHISASTSRVAGLAGNVSLWVSTNATLPTIPASIIATLDATGYPATRNNTATWTEIPRGLLGNGYFNLQVPSATNSESADININQWDAAGVLPVNPVTFFAIVVGFAPVAMNDVITINSIGLCSGDIATRPAPKTFSETLRACEQYYFKTFDNATLPAQNIGVQTGEYNFTAAVAGNFTDYAPTFTFNSHMRTVPNITFYNPSAANAQVRDESLPGDCSGTGTRNITQKELVFFTIGNVGTNASNLLGVHITADARFGVVN